MVISKQKLMNTGKETGYRVEIIEKVLWLMNILDEISNDSFLKDRLVLKGGTALNLFYFELPRLSVDIDLNYIGQLDKEAMLEEKPQVEERVKNLVARMGLPITRSPTAHSGGKMRFRYPSALGNQGNIEVDLNFMYRNPLFPVKALNSIPFAGRHVLGLAVLDIHELAAGKLTALLERQAGRDFFDANLLFNSNQIDYQKLRLAFTVYAALCTKKNLLTIRLDDIQVDHNNLKNKLIPVMKPLANQVSNTFEHWMKQSMQTIQQGYAKLLPFTDKEQAFIQAVQSGKAIPAELLTQDKKEIEKIKNHPALHWASKK